MTSNKQNYPLASIGDHSSTSLLAPTLKVPHCSESMPMVLDLLASSKGHLAQSHPPILCVQAIY